MYVVHARMRGKGGQRKVLSPSHCVGVFHPYKGGNTTYFVSEKIC